MHRLGYRTVERLVSVILYIYYIAHIFCLFFQAEDLKLNFFLTFEYIYTLNKCHMHRTEIRIEGILDYPSVCILFSPFETEKEINVYNS